MKKTVLLVVAFLSIGIADAQHYIGQLPTVILPDNGRSPDGKSLMCGHATSFQSAAINRPDGSAIIRRPYDILTYDLFMDWRNPLSSKGESAEARRFSGTNTITLRIDSANTSRLVFNAVSLQIDSIYFLATTGNSKIQLPSTFIQQPSDGDWSITLPVVPSKGDTLKMEVHYTHIGVENRGFLVYEKGHYVGLNASRDSVFIPERIVYTMSEPQDARYWMPCNDAPYDKAIASITVRVPYDPNPLNTNYSVSSNGTRTIGFPQITPDLSSMYRDYKWSDATPISTYLMVANASKFKEYSQWYKRVTNPNDSVEIMNFVWKDDYENTVMDGSKYNALFAFRNVPGMMESFSRLYGEYPFVKYGHTAVQPFQYGGMEHQTMTSVIRSWLYGRDESGIAHELMHQWTGDLTTCATWGDIWLNEGGATYGEALFYESWGGDEWYQKLMDSKRSYYINNQPQPPIYGIPLSNVFNYATTYCKGGWVYHMLRKTYGDSLYFQTIRTYLHEFRYKNAETEDMYNVFNREIPNQIVPLRTFYDQWLYSPGHPIYQLGTSQTANGSNQLITVTLEQTQNGFDVPEVFVMPVKITFFGKDNKRKVVSFVNDKRIQQEIFTTDFVIDSAMIDENNEILCEKTNLLTSVKNDEYQENSTPRVFPQPSQRGESSSFQFSIPTNETVSVEIISLLGQKIVSLHEGLLSAGGYSLSISTGQLAAGMYSIRMTVGKQTKEFPLVIVQ
jgi:aminopeptidase N